MLPHPACSNRHCNRLSGAFDRPTEPALDALRRPSWSRGTLTGVHRFTTGVGKLANENRFRRGRSPRFGVGTPPCGHAWRSCPTTHLALASLASVYLPTELPSFRDPATLRPQHLECRLPNRVQGPSGVTPPVRLRRRMLAHPVVLGRPCDPLRALVRPVYPCGQRSVDPPAPPTLRPLPPGITRPTPTPSSALMDLAGLATPPSEHRPFPDDTRYGIPRHLLR
jgi:hypothetical protein